MKKLKSGFLQAISSVIIGFLVTAVANVITLRKVRSWGIFYTLGWLGGSFLFKEAGLLETFDFVLNIIAPIGILFTRLIIWIRDTSHKMVSRRSRSTN